MLQWVALTRRDETRERRVTEIAELAAVQERPKPFR